jgi:AraC-type DNA-binding domain-containing proteins
MGFTPQIQAQELKAALSHYSTDNGLSSNAISNMAQDDYGFIWIATWNGLSRFDGYNFYNYRTGNGSHIPNLHNRILDLVIDNWQNVWMRMYDGRIFVLDRKLDKIINPLEKISGHDDLRTNYPLTVTSSGDVLASFDGTGLYKMRLDPNNHANNEPQLITTTNLTVKCMAEGYHNDIWVGTDKGVHRLDLSNLAIEHKGLFTDEDITILYSNGYNIYVGTRSGKILMFSYGQAPKEVTNAGQEITGLYVDNYGIVWYSDLEYGVCRYRPSTNDTKRFQQVVPVPEQDSRGSDFREAMGYLWMRMNHGGYGYYNRNTDEVEYFHNDPTNPWNLANTVNASLELNEGVIWESTNKRALDKLEIQKNTITRTMVVPNALSPLDNEVRAMFYDEQRKLLFLGNKNSCMFVIRQDGSRTAITTDSKGKPIGRPYGISKDSKGTYWMCSKDHGVFHIKPLANGGFDIRNYCHNDADKWSLSSDAAYEAVEDKHGNIWVATYGGGVNVLVPDKNGNYRAYHSKNVMRRYPYNSFMKIRTVAIDSDGKVWAGSTDGILILSLKDNNITINKLENTQEHPNNILLSTDIVCLASDKKGAMWVGTNGGGISHTIGKDSKGIWMFDTYSTEDGLPSEEIKSITVDNNNNVWFATDYIVCSFDPQKKILSTFGSLDGVGDVMLSEGAAVALPNDIVLFGTLNGYYTVDRKKLSSGNGSMLKLRITDFYINDELQSPRLNSIYDYYVPESKQVTLKNHNSVIAVRFASLNYQLQHRVHYQYMMEGYDTQWLNADKSRTVSYASLPTGIYHLRIKAFLLESPDSYDERVLEIIVPPYFLLSKNAVWFYMFFMGVLSLGIMFWRQRRLAYKENIRLFKLSADDTFEKKEDKEFIDMLHNWLEQNYSNAQVKADEMVTLANMSRSNFHNRLNDLTGQTPENFLQDFRLKKAVSLLEKSDKTIMEIALMTGFGNALNITRAFKQRMGLTPERYRQQHSTIGISAKANEEVQSTELVEIHKKEEDTDDYEIIED